MIAELLEGGAWQALPALLTYRLTHTDGFAADSFEVAFPTQAGQYRRLLACPQLRLREGGQTAFCGVADEAEAVWGMQSVTTVCGRGLAARLMDNQAGGAEYFQADLTAVLDRYVRPFGITQIHAPGTWQAKLWSVGAGTSCWRVLQGFCLLAGAPQPRFTRDGTLTIASEGSRFSLGEGALLSAAARLCRYGVVARQEVIDLTSGSVTQASLGAAAAYGITARQVATRSGPFTHAIERTAYQRIADAAKDLDTIEAVVPGAHRAQCGDIAEVNLPSLGASGEYTVYETCREFDGTRETTTMRLRKTVA